MATTEEIVQILLLAENRATGAFAGVETQLGLVARAAKAAQLAVGLVGVGGLVALGASVKSAVDFQSSMAKMAANTTLTNAQVQTLSQTILAMSAQTGTPITQLQTGIMHITDLGYSLTDSTKIAAAALKSAASTGADFGAVANVLTMQLHDFGLGANQAAGAMNVLHLASAMSNVTLDQFVTNTSKAVSTAANLHVPLVQVDAALAALSRHESLGQANTGLAGMLQKIVNPSKAAQHELELLSQKTGVNLVGDFSAGGLASRQLTGVLADLQLAFSRAGLSGATAAGMINQLIPATRGGLAATILLGTGASDFSSVLSALSDTWAGKTDPTIKAFTRTSQTAAYQFHLLTANLHVAAIEIGTAFLPVLTKLLAAVMPVITAMTQWIGMHADLAGKILVAVTAIGLLGGGFTAFSLILGPMAGMLGALLVPLLALGAAAGVAALAWRSDWGGIREITQSTIASLTPAFTQITAAFSRIATAFQRGGISAALNTALGQGRSLLSAFTAYLGGTAVPAMATALNRGEAALWQWIQRATPVALNQLKAWGAQLAAWLGGTGIPQVTAALSRGESALWSWIQRASGPAGNALSALFTAITGALEAKVPAIKGALAAGALALSGWLASVNWSKLAADIEQGILGAAGAVGSWMDNTLIKWMHKNLDPHIQSWYDTKHGIKWNALKDDIVSGIQSAASAVGSWMDNTLVKWLHTHLDPYITTWYSDKHGINWNGLKNDITSAISSAGSAVGSWMDSTLVPDLHRWLDPHIRSWFDSKHGIKWSGLKDDITSAIYNAGSSIGSWMDSTLVPDLHRWLDPKIQGWFDAKHGIKWDVLQSEVKTAISNAMQWVGGQMDGVMATLDKTTNTAITNAFKNASTWLVQSGKDLITGLITGMKDQTTTAATAAKNVGSSIVAGARDGILAGPQAAGHAVVGFFQGLIDTAKKVNQISSPSQVYYEIGQNMMQGAINGITSQHGALVGAVQNAFTAAAAAAGTARITPAQSATLGRSTAEQAALAQAAAQHAQNINTIEVNTVTGSPQETAQQLAAEQTRYLRQEQAIRNQFHLANMAASTQEMQAALTANAQKAAAVAAGYAKDIAGLTGVQRAKDEAHLHDLQYTAAVTAAAAADYGSKAKLDGDLTRLQLAHMRQQQADSAAITTAQKTAAAQAAQAKLQDTANQKVADLNAYAASMQGLSGVKLAQAQLHEQELLGIAAIAQLRASDYNDQKKFETDYAAFKKAQDAKIRADQNAITAAQNAASVAHLGQIATIKQADASAYANSIRGISGVRGAQDQLRADQLQGVATLAVINKRDFGDLKKYAQDYATFRSQQDAKIQSDRSNIISAENAVKTARQATVDATKAAALASKDLKQRLSDLNGELTNDLKAKDFSGAQQIANMIAVFAGANAKGLGLDSQGVSNLSAKNALTIQTAMAAAAKSAEAASKTAISQADTAAKKQAAYTQQQLQDQISLDKLKGNTGAVRFDTQRLIDWLQTGANGQTGSALALAIAKLQATLAGPTAATTAAASAGAAATVNLIRPQQTGLGSLGVSFGQVAVGNAAPVANATDTGTLQASQTTAANTTRANSLLTQISNTLAVVAGNTLPAKGKKYKPVLRPYRA